MTIKIPKFFHPTGDRVLLRIITEEQKSSVGIILVTDTVAAEVVAVGPGRFAPFASPLIGAHRLQVMISVGEIVALPKKFEEHCEVVMHGDVKHYVASEDLCLGVLRDA